jgi:hypothetical protein
MAKETSGQGGSYDPQTGGGSDTGGGAGGQFPIPEDLEGRPFDPPSGGGNDQGGGAGGQFPVPGRDE